MNTINLPWAGTASVSPTAPSTELKSHCDFSYTVTLWHGTFTEGSIMCIIIYGISEQKVLGMCSLPLVQTPQTLMWACSKNPAASLFRLDLHPGLGMRIN